MEPPSSLDDDAVRDEKLKVLRALKPIGRFGEAEHSPRLDMRRVRSMTLTEATAQLNEPSNTETYVAIKAEVDNWRWWRAVLSEDGKRLAAKH